VVIAGALTERNACCRTRKPFLVTAALGDAGKRSKIPSRVTRTRYGVSPWIDESPKKRRPEFPRFRDEAAYPVVIVGGGLAGIFTAYAFAAAGIKVAVLEADRIGRGGASRGPGILQGEAAASYRDVEARHGRKAARALFEASRRAVLDLAAAARRLGVTHIETHDGFRALSSWAAEEKPLARDAQLRRDAGLEATWLKPAASTREVGLDVGRAGVRLRDWGQANPYTLLTAFAHAAATRGAAIFERSEVQRVKTRGKYVDVHAEGGSIQADTVIVCTGEPTDLFRSLKRHVGKHRVGLGVHIGLGEGGEARRGGKQPHVEESVGLCIEVVEPQQRRERSAVVEELELLAYLLVAVEAGHVEVDRGKRVEVDRGAA
jgi:hypothetical protein